MAFWLRLLRALPLLLISPVLVFVAMITLALTDLAWWLFGRRTADGTPAPSATAATVVIPNWNGEDLLEKYLPSVEIALAGNAANEIIVVDNGSTDRSVELLRTRFPNVKVVPLERNLGFGGGSNAGFRAARNPIVVLLNSDMRVEPDFLAPLLAGFTDSRVFAVSCQIFLSDPEKRREETGLTEGWWQDGGLRVGHRDDAEVRDLYPCFYGGGGSCAFDRAKFLELGGFDNLLAPFYLEDTDLGYMAWKRGWKVLYQPASVVYHEHRGTIGKKFSEAYIQAVLKKNFLLFCWKNIHEWPRLLNHFAYSYVAALLSVAFGEEPGRTTLTGFGRAALQLPGAVASRWRAKHLAAITDTEAFNQPRGGHFRDTFQSLKTVPARPRVLFVSPYPILPPVHGGAVFMLQTLRELSRLCEVHAIVMLDYEAELEANRGLAGFCASLELLVRGAPEGNNAGSIVPNSVYEFRSSRLRWLIDRQILQKQIDIVQLEYTALGQYAERYRSLACILFEHDIYFQSVARGLEYTRGALDRIKARWEYLRALRFELRMLPLCDRVQVCTVENRTYIESFLPVLKGRVDDGLRAGITTARYLYPGGPRRPFTMLFLGSFRHAPNQVALQWFTRDVLPLIVAQCPEARLLVAGSDPPPPHAYHDPLNAIAMLGFVSNLDSLFAESAVFVCPIRSGSGVRVKLLEAFASGIPVVSTFIGAEGLARENGEFCWLADDAEIFAASVIRVLREDSTAMAARARAEVEQRWDMEVITRKLVASYRETLTRKRLISATQPDRRKPS